MFFHFKCLKFIILLKKIQTKLFPDIKINIKFILNNKKSNKIKIKTLNP